MRKVILSCFAILIVLLDVMTTQAQTPSFYLNEGLINDEPLVLSSKNWMICYPGSSGVIIGDKISVWDLDNGKVLKNIAIGNKNLFGISLGGAERYLILEFREQFEIYDLGSLQQVRIIPKNPIENSFCYIPPGAAEAFVSGSIRTSRYSLLSPTAAPVLLHANISADDWLRGRIIQDTLIFCHPDSLVTVDLKSGNIMQVLHGKNIFGSNSNISSFRLITTIRQDGKLLLAAERYPQPNQLALFSLMARKVTDTLNLPFRSNDFKASADGKTILVFADRYAKESFDKGYQVVKIIIGAGHMSAELNHFPFQTLNSFSVANECWKYGVYVLRNPDDGSVHILDANRDKLYELHDKGLLPNINVLNRNLVLCTTGNGITTLVDLTTGHEFTPDLLKGKMVFSVAGEQEKPLFNLFFREDKDQFALFNWLSAQTSKRVFTLSTPSIKLIPELNYKIGHLLSCRFFFKGDDFQQLLTANSPFNGQNDYFLKYHLDDARIEVSSAPKFQADITEPVTGGNSMFCRYVLPKEPGGMIDSVIFYSHRNSRRIAGITADEYHGLTKSYLPDINKMDLRPDEGALLLCGSSGDIFQFGLADGKLRMLNQLALKCYPSYLFGYCNNGHHIYQLSRDSLFIFDAASGKMINSVAGAFTPAMISSRDSHFICSDSRKRTVTIGSILPGGNTISMDWKNKPWIFNDMTTCTSAFGSEAFSCEATGDITVYDLLTGRVLFSHLDPLIKPVAFFDGSTLLYFDKSGLPGLLNYKTGEKVAFHSNIPIGELEEFDYLPEDSTLLSMSTNNLYSWNLKSRCLNYNLIVGDTVHYFLQDNNGHFTYNKLQAAQVLCRLNDQWLSPESMDLLDNRPDLFAMDNISKKFYRGLYEKRIAYAGVDTAHLNRRLLTGYSVCRVLNADTLGVVSNPVYHLHVAAQGKVPLKKLMVYVNDVPVGAFFTRHSATHDTTVAIKLEYGKNQITAYYIADNGIASNEINKSITYESGTPVPVPETFFVGIGVSTYRYPDMNLKYSVKDIKGLDSLFRYQYGNHYHSKLLLDDSVTSDKITTIRRFLRNSRVGDRVIIAVSGHGLIGKDLNFYFAAYNTDPARPETGIAYTDLEGLFNGLFARKRLLLLDACHSGEIDKTAYFQGNPGEHPASALEVSLNVAKAKSALEEGQDDASLQKSFELMQDLFADRSANSSGAIIIAAARGAALANEGDRWGNGVFTYSIKLALKDKKADLNNNGRISITELKNYVIRSVGELTDGAQIPVVRKELLGTDWDLW